MKSRVTRSFSSSVKDASGTKFESLQTFKSLGSYINLQDVGKKKLSENWLKVENDSVIFRTSRKTISDNIEVQALQCVQSVSGFVQLRDMNDEQRVGEKF